MKNDLNIQWCKNSVKTIYGKVLQFFILAQYQTVNLFHSFQEIVADVNDKEWYQYPNNYLNHG